MSRINAQGAENSLIFLISVKITYTRGVLIGNNALAGYEIIYAASTDDEASLTLLTAAARESRWKLVSFSQLIESRSNEALCASSRRIKSVQYLRSPVIPGCP